MCKWVMDAKSVAVEITGPGAPGVMTSQESLLRRLRDEHTQVESLSITKCLPIVPETTTLTQITQRTELTGLYRCLVRVARVLTDPRDCGRPVIPPHQLLSRSPNDYVSWINHIGEPISTESLRFVYFIEMSLKDWTGSLNAFYCEIGSPELSHPLPQPQPFLPDISSTDFATDEVANTRLRRYLDRLQDGSWAQMLLVSFTPADAPDSPTPAHRKFKIIYTEMLPLV